MLIPLVQQFLTLSFLLSFQYFLEYVSLQSQAFHDHFQGHGFNMPVANRSNLVPDTLPLGICKPGDSENLSINNEKIFFAFVAIHSLPMISSPTYLLSLKLLNC